MTSIISRPQLQTSYVCFHDSSSPYPDSVFKAFCKHIQNPQEYLFPWLLLEKTSQAFSLGNIFQLPVATSLPLPQLLLGRLTSWQAAALLAQEAGPAQSERASESGIRNSQTFRENKARSAGTRRRDCGGAFPTRSHVLAKEPLFVPQHRNSQINDGSAT